MISRQFHAANRLLLLNRRDSRSAIHAMTSAKAIHAHVSYIISAIQVCR